MSNEYNEQEIAKRRDDAIRRALNTPPTPIKKVVGKTERAQSQGETKKIRAARKTPKTAE